MTDLVVQSPRSHLSGLIRLLRPGAVLASAAVCLVGAYLASPENWPAVLLAALTVASAVAASNVFNDVVDLDVDRINVPDRPLPSGHVTVGTAMVLASILALLAILGGLALQPGHTVAVVLVLAVSAWYSLQLKRILVVGPLVVGLLLASALVFGWTVGTSVFSTPVVVGAAEIAIFTFGRESLKGVRDIEGDRLSRVETVANVWGAKTAVMVFAFCCGIVMVVAALSGSLTHFAVVTLLVGIPGIVGSMVWWTSDRDRTAWAITGSAWLWITGLAGIALL